MDRRHILEGRYDAAMDAAARLIPAEAVGLPVRWIFAMQVLDHQATRVRKRFVADAFHALREGGPLPLMKPDWERYLLAIESALEQDYDGKMPSTFATALLNSCIEILNRTPWHSASFTLADCP